MLNCRNDKLHSLPRNVPNTGVDDDQIWFQPVAEVLHDALHVVRVDAGHKVEADQVVRGLVLSDLTVSRSIVHLAQASSFHQAVLLEAHLTLQRDRK